MRKVSILGVSVPWFGVDQIPMAVPVESVDTAAAVQAVPVESVDTAAAVQAFDEIEIYDDYEPIDGFTNAIPKGSVSAHRPGHWGHSYAISWDGEKNYGEIGPLVEYHLNHAALRMRSYEAYLTNEIARTVTDRFTMWILDKGLKLQMKPAKKVLESEGIIIDTEAFNDIVEARFSVWANSKMVSHNGMHSLNQQSKNTFKAAGIGGDVLVIQRFKKGKQTIQIIDGGHVVTPLGREEIPKNNKIIQGVELDINGRHIAYHVKVKGGKVERVLAWSKSTGLRMAWLVYGSEYRIDDVRGLPVMSTSLETLAKIDRYKEAAVGSAEERQKIAFAIEHNQFSDGQNPMEADLGELFDADSGGNSTAIPRWDQGEKTRETIATTMNKTAINMPIGAKLSILESKNEMFFKEFYDTNAHIICAALGIPPNVAFSAYTDSFSASRAATKDWEHTMDVKRSEFQDQFYSPILALWMHIQILDFKIQAPGYLRAFATKNWMIVESYLQARFVGPMFPHVDPLKEAKAERVKLGSAADHLPLTTLERSTELLNGGDADANIEQLAKEIDLAKTNGIFIEIMEEEEDEAD